MQMLQMPLCRPIQVMSVDSGKVITVEDVSAESALLNVLYSFDPRSDEPVLVGEGLLQAGEWVVYSNGEDFI